LQDAKKRLHGRTTIELQCLRLKTNEHEWGLLKRSYKALGADRLVFKTAQLYNYTNGHPLMPSDTRYSRYIQSPDGLYHRRPMSKKCLRVWSGAVITTRGEVLPCCYDKAHTYTYGNIMEQPLRSLYGNAKALAFRRAALDEGPEICKECWK
jgi:radical SAM protein with 4Fe4S-binding SPASM domain